MSDSIFSDGRRAALERRRALSQGKAALPPSRERTRAGIERGPASPQPSGGDTMPVPSATAPAAPSASVTGGTSLTGRLLSMLRRRQASAGKAGLAPPAGAGGDPVAVTAPATSNGALASTAGASELGVSVTSESGHAMARRLRQQRAQVRSSEAPTRPARAGRLQYSPKVVVDQTAGGQRVTGLKYTEASKVTGAEAGLGKPVSGTPYISPNDGAQRPQPPKIGLAMTAGGQVVSGTLVRSRVAITGDEAGEQQRVTGDLDGAAGHDVTPREASDVEGIAQFARQANPHGHSVFGVNLGRGLQVAASRQRDRERPVESTEGGRPITGSAIGRSGRVTGDRAGACRVITGDQYLAPASAQAECGGQGGGTGSPATAGDGQRRDPVTGSKVVVSATWGGARITGASVEHQPGVTGDEAGSCRVVTGTPYQGPDTLYGWCEPADAAQAERRLSVAPAEAAVTGDVPLHGGGVTGTARGAGRDITGTPYYRDTAMPAAAGDAIDRIDQGFSVRSPQRQAQRARRTEPRPATAAALVTGSFAQGQDKITGNVEFGFQPRRAADDDKALPAITGEGGVRKARITGDAWRADSRVTGTDGPTAWERNPSERAGQAQAFAGSRVFKAKAQHEEPRQIVTGMVGWSPKSAAKVTLSGGAQG